LKVDLAFPSLGSTSCSVPPVTCTTLPRYVNSWTSYIEPFASVTACELSVFTFITFVLSLLIRSPTNAADASKYESLLARRRPRETAEPGHQQTPNLPNSSQKSTIDFSINTHWTDFTDSQFSLAYWI